MATSVALLGCGDDGKRDNDTEPDAGLALDAGMNDGGTLDAQFCPMAEELWADIDIEAFAQLPGFETLMVEDIMPAEAASYWELRRTSPGAPTYEVLLSAGELCAEAENAEVCRQEFEDLTAEEGFGPGCPPGECYQYLVVNRGDTHQVIASEDELVTFLGNIDTPTEAAAVAWANGYGWDVEDPAAGGIRAVEEGYQLLVTELTQECDPIITERVQLMVSNEGEITVERRQIYEVLCGACI